MSNVKTVVPRAKYIPEELFQLIQQNIPIVCVDLVVLRKGVNGETETLLIKRKIFPEENKWCIIGGRIIKDEVSLETINRQAKAELGVSVSILSPWKDTRPIAVLNDPKSDAQKHFVVLVFPVIITAGTVNKEGPEFSEARWFPLTKLPEIIGFNQRDELDALINTKEKYNLK